MGTLNYKKGPNLIDSYLSNFAVERMLGPNLHFIVASWAKPRTMQSCCRCSWSCFLKSFNYCMRSLLALAICLGLFGLDPEKAVWFRQQSDFDDLGLDGAAWAKSCLPGSKQTSAHSNLKPVLTNRTEKAHTSHAEGRDNS